MAKPIWVVHYSKHGKRVRNNAEVVIEYKAFVSMKAADIFIGNLVKRYPHAWASRTNSVLYTVEVQPEID